MAQLLIDFKRPDQLIHSLAPDVKPFQGSLSDAVICGQFPDCGKKSFGHVLRLSPRTPDRGVFLGVFPSRLRKNPSRTAQMPLSRTRKLLILRLTSRGFDRFSADQNPFPQPARDYIQHNPTTGENDH